MRGTGRALCRELSTGQQMVLKSGARDTDRATGPDLSTVYSKFKSMLRLFVSFQRTKIGMLLMFMRHVLVMQIQIPTKT